MKQLNRIIVLVTFILLLSNFFAAAADVKIKIAPFVGFSDDGKTTEYDTAYIKLTQQLQQYWFDGLIEISSFSAEQTGNIQSAFDAAAVCQTEKCDYLIYGYIKKTGNAVSAEAKLFSNPDKKVEQTFYAQDNTDEYERLIITLSQHIGDYLCKKTGTVKQPVPEEQYNQIISFPFTVGYWSHINDVWNNHILGIIRCTTGLEFQPPIPLDNSKNHKHTLSFRIEAGFRYAYGNPDYYPANYFSVSTSLPALFSVKFDRQNQITLGMGPFYDFSILQIKEKYKEKSTHYDNNFGIELLLNYIFSPSEKVKISLGPAAFIPLTESSGIWMSFDAGCIIKISEKKVTLK
jgi:hypothetical protein